MRIAKTIFALSLALTACTGEIHDPVTSAENDFEAGMFESAKSICDSLVSSDRLDGLSVDELCRISVLMVKLAEHGDEEANMAMATRCMQAALSRDADSVFSFVHTLPVDQQSQTVLIQQLSNSIDQPYTINDTIVEPIY